MKKLALALFLLLPVAAQAADTPKLDPQVCRNLSAAYQPGVDVHGKPVTAADLNASSVAMPEKFSFDVNVDVAQKVGLPLPPGAQTLAKVGTITYEKGVLAFNGKPLDSNTATSIKALCVDEKPAPKPTIEKQQGVDVVN
jgi:hypothetical protein